MVRVVFSSLNFFLALQSYVHMLHSFSSTEHFVVQKI